MNGEKKQFNNVNASSLFHFTKELETLKSIIREGLRFSYAFESMSSRITTNVNYPSIPDRVGSIYKNTGVAIPMISFCDIPITRATAHMKKYGYYMIGLDKAHLLDWYKAIINPVLYVHSNNLNDAFIELSNIYAETVKQQNAQILSLSEQKEKIGSKEIQNIAVTYGLRKFFIRYILGLTKPTIDPKTKYGYYNEREWRAFLSDISFNNSDWVWEITKQDYEHNRDKWNEELSKNFENYITLYEENLRVGLTFIVVKDEDEVNEIIKFILNSQKIFGYTDVSQETRHNLISKITSMERIARDY